MDDRDHPLYPWPLDALLARIEREWRTRGEIFGLSGRRFFRADPAADLAWELDGARAATPAGPAAGPHTQLAQNIVLGWLAGARSFELKTVQVLDELQIPRPCIDMQGVGYNVEWSQELKLRDSLAEYVKAWVLLAVLRRWEPLRAVLGEPGEHVFELSVGYDLPGIRSAAMTDFLAALRRPAALIADLRPQIGGAFAALREVPVPEPMVRGATLSTFHGCPPEQIEGIVRHLMQEHGLDVTIKLNPTLLGQTAVAEILQERLGYADIPLVPEAFAQDLKFERAVRMIRDLQEFAAGAGRRLGLKVCNTLVVGNARGVLPGERAYLSGRPLYVLAIALLDRLNRALPGLLRLGTQQDAPVPVAFSAGVDKDNLASTVALGLRPVTVCSDLLRPGGYGRLAQALRGLQKDMKEAGAADLAAWGRVAQGRAEAAGLPDAVAHLAASLAEPARAARYGRTAAEKPLRRVDQALQMFDCTACNNCVSVCPNNAFLSVPSAGVAGLQAKQQYLVLAELCNDCGNCTTFCPEQGDPQRIKPRLYTMAAAQAARDGDGFLVSGPADAPRVAGEELAAALLEELLKDGALPFAPPTAK